MIADPFLIEGPAVISFSGGRTSAYMLWRILQAHGGTLPADVFVYFANTGKEREETLRFVHECGSRWGVKVIWLEWRARPEQVEVARERGARPDVLEWLGRTATEAAFERVGFNSAHRKGEPFSGLIATRGYVPNGNDRFCSPNLKIRPMERWVRDVLGWDHWSNAVGLRYDEGYRVLRMARRNAAKKDRHSGLMPLADGRVTQSEVLKFWLGSTEKVGDGARPQGFDLDLYSYEGNCDLCYLKRRGKLAQLIRDNPGSADWWVNEEATSCAIKPDNRQFKAEESFAGLRRSIIDQPTFDFMDGADDEADVECGLTCGGDSPAEIAALQAEYERQHARTA